MKDIVKIGGGMQRWRTSPVICFQHVVFRIILTSVSYDFAGWVTWILAQWSFSRFQILFWEVSPQRLQALRHVDFQVWAASCNFKKHSIQLLSLFQTALCIYMAVPMCHWQAPVASIIKQIHLNFAISETNCNVLTHFNFGAWMRALICYVLIKHCVQPSKSQQREVNGSELE